jgi:hypothetical protein
LEFVLNIDAIIPIASLALYPATTLEVDAPDYCPDFEW